MRIFEKWVLEEITEHKRCEVLGEGRRIHNEELYRSAFFTKYYSGDQFEKNEVGEACSTYGK